MCTSAVISVQTEEEEEAEEGKGEGDTGGGLKTKSQIETLFVCFFSVADDI